MHVMTQELQDTTNRMIPKGDYSLESSSLHTKIELPQDMQNNSCDLEHHPLISSDEANYLLELLGEQEQDGKAAKILC